MPDDSDRDEEYFFSGHIHVARELLNRERYRTISDPTTTTEDIFYYNGQIYERGEEHISTVARDEFMSQWLDMLRKCNDYLDAIRLGHQQSRDVDVQSIATLSRRLKNSIHRGPTVNEVNEVKAEIRSKTYTSVEELNPVSHTPFKNGLLNLETRKLESFTPDPFYTWQIQANYLDRHVTLLDCPRYAYYLKCTYHPADIPTVLAYSGYALQPNFKRHKVIVIFGRERVGKGVTARIMKGLNPKGYGAIEWEKLQTEGNRFKYQNIVGKSLLVDPEVRRVNRKGFNPDYSALNRLFGGDTLDKESKGKTSQDYVSRAKGMFIGNLPAPPVDNPAWISRSILIRSKDERNTAEIPDIDKDILEKERDEIATLLMECYFGLEDRGFIFPNELINDSTQELWNLMADSIENFLEEMTQYVEGSRVSVDALYDTMKSFCTGKGIPVPARQTFTRQVSKTYKKKRDSMRGERPYYFIDCQLITDIDVDPQQKLDTEVNGRKRLEDGTFWNRFKRVQLRSYSKNYYLSDREKK